MPWLTPSLNNITAVERTSLLLRDRECSLHSVLAKLCAGLPVYMAAIGASITFGHGVPPRAQHALWPAAVARRLRQVWPAANITMRNAAVPATSAGFAALCLNSLLGARPVDLLLVEYSHTTEHEDAMRMLLNMVRWRGEAVLLVSYFHPVDVRQWMRCDLGAAEEPPWMRKAWAPPCNATALIVRPKEPRFLDMFRQMRVPVVSSHVLHERSPSAPVAAARWLRSIVSRDGRHITTAGHAMIARLVVHGVLASLQGCARENHRLRAAIASMHTPSGSAAVEESTVDERDSFCARGVGLLQRVDDPRAQSAAARWSAESAPQEHARPYPRRSVRLPSGWTYLDDGGGKPGLSTAIAGSTLPLALNTTRLRRGVVHVGFLSSYEGMGNARLRCVRGCQCAPTTLSAQEVQLISLTREVGIPVALEQPGARCMLDLTTAASAEGSRFKLIALTLTTERQQRIYQLKTSRLFRVAGEGAADYLRDTSAADNQAVAENYAVRRMRARRAGGGHAPPPPRGLLARKLHGASGVMHAHLMRLSRWTRRLEFPGPGWWPSPFRVALSCGALLACAAAIHCRLERPKSSHVL